MMYGAAKDVIDAALETGIFPAIAVEIGSVSGRQWTYAAGSIGTKEAPRNVCLDTVFDLASLTKVIATTTLVIRHVDAQTLDLDEPIQRSFSAWNSKERATVTIRDLLRHASGLPAYLPLYQKYAGRQAFEAAICSSPLEYAPRSQAIYSDLGFMLLGFLLADSDFDQKSLDHQFGCVVEEQSWGEINFRPSSAWLERIAPTEMDNWRGRLLRGEVHDENCFALGSVSGHAGLFGTSAAVGAFARDTLRAALGETTYGNTKTVQTFIRRSDIPGSSRALGWDTMLTTSSCGRWMSDKAFGHTGFTGTSLWIDPLHDTYIVLLTNRVHPTRDNNRIVAFRPKLHDAIMRERQRQP